MEEEDKSCGEGDAKAAEDELDVKLVSEKVLEPRVTSWDVLALVVSILSHIIDVALDLNLAYRYFKDNKMVYFGLTLVFILFPAFVNTFMSVRMYVLSEDTTESSRMAVKKWTVRIIIMLFQLAPIMRYCDSLMYAIKSRRAEKRQELADQKKYYELMLKEDSDVALLRVFECFLEAAPQQILQVAIVLIDRGRGSTYQLVHQFGSIVSSLLSMAWSMASYHRSIRFCQLNKRNITWAGTAVQFLWHFNVTVSRILSISCVASVYPVYAGIACSIHSIVMTCWLFGFEHTQFSVRIQPNFKAKLSEVLFCSILGLVYIFTYLTPSEGSTRNRYLVYYPLCFVENIGCMTLWAVTADDRLKTSWYFAPLIISGVVPFLIGISFMLLYYTFFHPETSQRRVQEYSPNSASAQTQTLGNLSPGVPCITSVGPV